MMRPIKKLAVTGLAWAVALSVSLPILWMTLTAFKTDLDALQLPPKILFIPTLDNFAAANGTVPILRPILNSVVESGGATALCFLFAFPAAYALAFHGGRSRNAVLLGMLMTRFMPGIGIMLPMYLFQSHRLDRHASRAGSHLRADQPADHGVDAVLLHARDPARYPRQGNNIFDSVLLDGN